MVLPSAPNSISLLEIRNEFVGQSLPNPSTYGSANTDLFNINYYRGKYYLTGVTYVAFSSGALDMDSFRGKASNCVCDCNCVCACGNGG